MTRRLRLARHFDARALPALVGLAMLPCPPAAATETAPGADGKSAPAPAPPRPGSHDIEHRFGLGVGYAHAAHVGVGAALGRFDYTFGWRGWGLGVALALDLDTGDAATGKDLTFGGVALRRSFPIGAGRMWGAAELGIARIRQGERGAAEVILYHGTSSAAELGFEFWRAEAVRPFVGVRLDLPWYATEIETLTAAPGADGDLMLIGHSRRWTPVYGLWGGIAL